MQMEPLPVAGRNNPRDTIDMIKMTSRHVWSTHHMTSLNFRNLMEESTSSRTDMMQYRALAQVDGQKAKDTFSMIGNVVCLFEIPETLQCDRTFARGSNDAYYLDAMDEYLSRQSEELKIEDVPLLQRSLDSQSFSAFKKRADYFREHIERRRIQRWVPGHAHEQRHFSDMKLSESFPKVEMWINDVFQPAALPVPSPFVSYYYNLELRKCQDRNGNELNEREKRLLFCLRNEHYVLFINSWWKEATHGGRQFVLDSHTIDTLQSRCASIATMAGKPVLVIIEHMRSATAKPEKYHNWMVFDHDEMEDSTFVWARNGPKESMPGEFDLYEASGVTLYCNINNRRISNSRNTCATFRRGRSFLDKTVTVPDLERVAGLVPIIQQYGWNRRGNIKLSHLLENLVNLHSCTNGILNHVSGRLANVPSVTNRPVQHVGFGNQYLLSDQRNGTQERSSGRDLVPYTSHRSNEQRYYNREQRDDRDYRVGSSSGGVGAPSTERYCSHRDEASRRSRKDYNGNERDHYYNERNRYQSYSSNYRYQQDNHRESGYRYNEYRGMNDYQDFDDSRQLDYGGVEQNMEGRRYRRTEDPITGVQVDVLTEGNRTPGGDNTRSDQARFANNPQYEPKQSQRNQPDQAGEDQVIRRGELAHEVTVATPYAPDSVRHMLSRNGHAFLALSRAASRHNQGNDAGNIRSDEDRNESHAVVNNDSLAERRDDTAAMNYPPTVNDAGNIRSNEDRNESHAVVNNDNLVEQRDDTAAMNDPPTVNEAEIIRSDENRNESRAVINNDNLVEQRHDIADMDDFPTGNFPWLFQDSQKRGSDPADENTSSDSAKRARVENQDDDDGSTRNM